MSFVLVSFPLLWFVMRETGVSGVGRLVTDVLSQEVGLTVAALSLALVAYVLGSTVVEFPAWFEALASAVGVVVGWPLLLAVLLTYAVGNAVPALQDVFAFEAGFVVLDVALSAAWLFVPSDWVARRALPGTVARTGP